MIGVVLAGGRSQRMGQDKALLTIGGERLLDRQFALLREAGSRAVYVSGLFQGYPCIEDNYTNCGPIAGIEAAMVRLPDEPIMFLAVDMPLIDSATLVALTHRPQEAATCYRDAWLPLLVANLQEQRDLVSRTCRQKSDTSIRQLCKSLNAYQLEPPLSDTLCNTNTPAQWLRATGGDAIMKENCL